MNELNTPPKIKWIGVRSAKDVPNKRPTVKCPYCQHEHTIRKQMEEGKLLRCSNCHKDFRLIKVVEPAWNLVDMAYSLQFNIDTGNYAMPAYILELIFAKNDLETAYNEWCKWKGLDPTKKDWEVDNADTVK